MNDDVKDQPGRRTRRCPICGKPAEPAEPALAPFCSRRCADVDLSRWLSGVYAIPVTEDADEDGEKTSGAPPSGGKGEP